MLIYVVVAICNLSMPVASWAVSDRAFADSIVQLLMEGMDCENPAIGASVFRDKTPVSRTIVLRRPDGSWEACPADLQTGAVSQDSCQTIKEAPVKPNVASKDRRVSRDRATPGREGVQEARKPQAGR